MKPTAGRDRERHVAQPEREDAADAGERHAGEHAQRVDEVAIGQIQQARRSSPRATRHDDQQPRAWLAPGSRTGRPNRCDSGPAACCTCSATLLAGLGDEAAQVAAAHVAGHRDAPLAPFARDRGRALHHLRRRPAATAACARRWAWRSAALRCFADCSAASPADGPPAGNAAGPRRLRPAACCRSTRPGRARPWPERRSGRSGPA